MRFIDRKAKIRRMQKCVGAPPTTRRPGSAASVIALADTSATPVGLRVDQEDLRVLAKDVARRSGVRDPLPVNGRKQSNGRRQSAEESGDLVGRVGNGEI